MQAPEAERKASGDATPSPSPSPTASPPSSPRGASPGALASLAMAGGVALVSALQKAAADRDHASHGIPHATSTPGGPEAPPETFARRRRRQPPTAVRLKLLTVVVAEATKENLASLSAQVAASKPDVVVIQGIRPTLGDDAAILGDAYSEYETHSIRDAAMHAESRFISLRSWSSYGIYLAIRALAGRAGERWWRAAARAAAPVREAAAANGGVQYVYQRLARIATDPLQGHTISVRKCAAMSSMAHDTTALGEDALAQRVLVVAQPPASASPGSASRCLRVWLVSAVLGVKEPEQAAVRLTEWLKAAERSSPADAAFILLGEGLAGRAPLTEWGARPLGAVLARAPPGLRLEAGGGGAALPALDAACGRCSAATVELTAAAGAGSSRE